MMGTMCLDEDMFGVIVLGILYQDYVVMEDRMLDSEKMMMVLLHVCLVGIP